MCGGKCVLSVCVHMEGGGKVYSRGVCGGTQFGKGCAGIRVVPRVHELSVILVYVIQL